MARKKKNTLLSTAAAIIIITAIAWMKYKETSDSTSQNQVSYSEHGDQKNFPHLTPVSLSSSTFETLENCTLIDHRNNDGDSFHVRTPKGEKEFRLYYVDAPESRLHQYNPKRIAEQGIDMGGLNQKQTTGIGIEAKSLTKQLLKGKKFRVSTKWENVYDARRQYAFVIVQWQGQERYLHELLVAHGLARIHTKPMTLPDNTAASRHKARLRKLEKYAKNKNHGAWRLN